MPLQWLPLQQRQQQMQRPRSAVSEALTPKKAGISGAMPQRKGFMEEQRELEAKEAERKYNEKMMKMQHEQEMEKLKFAAGAKEDAQKQQTTMGNVVAQAQQQGAQKQQIEDNPEPSAKAMYDLIKSMPDDTQNVLLNQLFTPTQPAGGISSAGKQVTMPEKYNPIASVFLSKGWATIDKGGSPILSDPEREFEKATFTIVEKGGKVYKLNTATGVETELGSKDEPEELTTKVIMEVKKEAADIANKTGEKVEDVEHDIYVDIGVEDKTAQDLSKFKLRPKDKGTDYFKNFVNWITGKKPKEPTKEDWEKAAGAGEGAFDEENVNDLIEILPDELTPAQRADLINQGATEADITEAEKRKKEGK